MTTETACSAFRVPAGFQLLTRGGPYFSQLGPVYGKHTAESGFVIGLRLQAGHTNVNGVAHGGMLMTLADAALGIAILTASGAKSVATVNMSTDFAAPARIGDWLEVSVDVQRIGGRLAFANSYIQVDGRRILRASGIFAVSSKTG
jgi:uncharacterized protein (TIGR00369 family)